jgi:acyl-CoA thioesterase-1
MSIPWLAKLIRRIFILIIALLAVLAIANPANADKDSRVILFLGNSITAGYGLSPSQAYPALIQKKIDSLGLAFKVINAGLSGETTAGGLRRIDWMLRQKVDVLVIELGGNDGLRGIKPEVTKQNLQAIVDKARQKNPDVKIVIAGMQVPPNLGPEYTKSFKRLYSDLAKKNSTSLIPFILDGVGGKPDLNLPDGIHPTAQGHKIVAETVWQVLEPVIQSFKR